MVDPIKQAVAADVTAVKTAVATDVAKVDTFFTKLKAAAAHAWPYILFGLLSGFLIAHIARHGL
jgi:hypothetical protein